MFEVNNNLEQSVSFLCANPANQDFVKVLKCLYGWFTIPWSIAREMHSRVIMPVVWLLCAGSLWHCAGTSHLAPSWPPLQTFWSPTTHVRVNLASIVHQTDSFCCCCTARVELFLFTLSKPVSYSSRSFAQSWWNSEMNIRTHCWIFFVFYFHLIICYS